MTRSDTDDTGRFSPDVETAPDGIDWFRARGDAPTIVSLSDVHGHLGAFRRALTAVGRTDAYEPVVTSDTEGQLHWADNDHVLLINGDLIDRGPHSDGCLALVERLIAQAPPGRVRYLLGNHEMAIMFPAVLDWTWLFSGQLDAGQRRAFLRTVAAGGVGAAFNGYRHTYSHAGRTEPFDVASANRQARTAAKALLDGDAVGPDDDTQRTVIAERNLVFGLGGRNGRGADARLLWMDFSHMTAAAPPQVVGHTRQRTPTTVGDVACQNLIEANQGTPGGEGVFVETPAGLEAVLRTADGVTRMPLDTAGAEQ
jgi:hypothetical protein